MLRPVKRLLIPCALIVWLASALVPTAQAQDVWCEPLFPSVQFEGEGFTPGGAPAEAPCPPPRHQDFSVHKPPRSFPNCPEPVLSWELPLPCQECDKCNRVPLPAHAVRAARWYTNVDFVPLRRDQQERIVLSRRGTLVPTIEAVTTNDFDYPLDAGGNFLIGWHFAERMSLEASYLGSYEWQDSISVRNADVNILLSNGNLSSPFTPFGLTQGLDFNDLVEAEARSRLENVELNLRYRPRMPYNAFDVSFLYGIRYIHIDESLSYFSQSDIPAPQGALNTVNVGTENDLIGAQIGLSSHFLLTPRMWFDWDLNNNHVRQNTFYENVDENGVVFTNATSGDRNDTSFTGDVEVIANYQLLPRFTVRLGYQATWVTSVASAAANFERDINILRLGPGDVQSTDTICYHGPVLGFTWVR
jgi:hypothetical protein